MRRVVRRTLFLAAVLTCHVAAAGERLVIRSLDLSGPEVPVRATEVRNDFVGGVAAAGFEIVPEEELTKQLDRAPQLATCTSDLCLSSIGKALGARWALAASIEVMSSSLVRVSARVVDAKSGKVAATVDKRCDGPCTWAENRDLVSGAGLALRGQLEPLIALENQPRAITAPVITGQPVELVPNRTRWALRGAAIGSGVLAIAGFILGGVEASRADDLSCSGAFPDAFCMRRRDTGTGQALGFAVGSVFLVGAGVLAYLGWRHPRRGAASGTAAGSGAPLLLGGRE